MLDGGTVRFALLATAPFLFCVSLFFSLQVRTRSRRTLLTYFAHTIYSGDHEHLVCARPRGAVPREQPVLQRGGAEAEPGGRQPPPAHHDPDAGVQGESEGDDVRVLSPFFPGVILAIRARTWIRRPGFHVDDRWDLRARRDLRGIAVSPLGLGGEIAIAALLGSWNEAGAYRDELFRCGLVSFLVASGVGWNADARWRLDGDA